MATDAEKLHPTEIWQLICYTSLSELVTEVRRFILLYLRCTDVHVLPKFKRLHCGEVQGVLQGKRGDWKFVQGTSIWASTENFPGEDKLVTVTTTF